MCTALVLNHVRSDYPLVLATNRDEFYARRSSGPLRLLDTPSTVGGRDLVAGGTWMGVTQQGLFVGVTNQRTARPPDRSRRSRGALVLEALALGETEAISALVRGLDGREYNGFNLLWGDATQLYVGYGREQQREVAIEPVPHGLHLLPNDRLDSPDFPKVARARSLLAPQLQADFPALLEALQSTLADRALPAPAEVDARGSAREQNLEALRAGTQLDREQLRQLAALCIHTPLYGTRCSSIVALQPGRVAHYLYADGPPDATPFVDVMGLF
jgi:uncharacterized protein with NRDE domain